MIINRLATLLRLLTTLWYIRDVKSFDVILVHRDLIPETRITFLEKLIAFRKKALVFDFDDAIHLGGRETKLRKILPHFAWIMAGNSNLMSFAFDVNSSVSVIPTVVNTDTYIPRQTRESGPIRLGWTGSKTTRERHLPLLEAVLTEISNRYDVEFIVIADKDPKLQWPGVAVRFIRWSPEDEIKGLHLMDIGLMPLVDEAAERGKCGLKAISYMAVGIPAVVSPIGANADIVVNEVTGFHCTSGADWIRVLSLLIEDTGLRQTMGRAGRKHVESTYSVTAVLPQILAIFEKVRMEK